MAIAPRACLLARETTRERGKATSDKIAPQSVYFVGVRRLGCDWSCGVELATRVIATAQAPDSTWLF